MRAHPLPAVGLQDGSQSLSRKGRLMTDAELRALLRLLVEKTALHQCSWMQLTSAFELLEQQGYRIIPPELCTCVKSNQPNEGTKDNG